PGRGTSTPASRSHLVKSSSSRSRLAAVVVVAPAWPPLLVAVATPGESGLAPQPATSSAATVSTATTVTAPARPQARPGRFRMDMWAPRVGGGRAKGAVDRMIQAMYDSCHERNQRSAGGLSSLSKQPAGPVHARPARPAASTRGGAARGAARRDGRGDDAPA